MAFFLFAQTPEWETYCKLRNIVGHETLQPDSAFDIYYTMDSIYNGIPFFTDLYEYLETSIAAICNCFFSPYAKVNVIFVSVIGKS